MEKQHNLFVRFFFFQEPNRMSFILMANYFVVNFYLQWNASSFIEKKITSIMLLIISVFISSFQEMHAGNVGIRRTWNLGSWHQTTRKPWVLSENIRQVTPGVWILTNYVLVLPFWIKSPQTTYNLHSVALSELTTHLMFMTHPVL